MDDDSVSFTSFLAGLLLCYKKIEYFALCEKVMIFTGVTNFDVVGEGSELSSVLCFEDNKLCLKSDYDDQVYYEGNVYVLEELLFSFTNEIVRDYFKLNERYENFNKFKRKH